MKTIYVLLGVAAIGGMMFYFAKPKRETIHDVVRTRGLTAAIELLMSEGLDYEQAANMAENAAADIAAESIPS